MEGPHPSAALVAAYWRDRGFGVINAIEVVRRCCPGAIETTAEREALESAWRRRVKRDAFVRRLRCRVPRCHPHRTWPIAEQNPKSKRFSHSSSWIRRQSASS